MIYTRVMLLSKLCIKTIIADNKDHTLQEGLHEFLANRHAFEFEHVEHPHLNWLTECILNPRVFCKINLPNVYCTPILTVNSMG